MLPTREEAERLVAESETMFPGPWGDHSRTAAHCAEAIAARCPGMDAEKAYIVGLLHDIGRRFGHRHLGHVVDGYTYMMSLGYDEAARVCLTHSFNMHDLADYIGNVDTTPEENKAISDALSAIPEFDDYDLLIQLCDSLAGPGIVLDQVDRMNDVKSRYGSYPQEKWDRNVAIRVYFEEKMGTDIYQAVDKDHYHA